MFLKHSKSVCLFQNNTFFSLIYSGLFFWDGLLLYGILRKRQMWKQCKYWVTEMWTLVNWNQQRMVSELVSSCAKGRDIGRETELKYLHSWRFKVFIVLERKHLQFLSSVEILTFSGTQTPTPYPQLPMHIFCFKQLQLEDVSFSGSTMRMLLPLFYSQAGRAGQGDNAWQVVTAPTPLPALHQAAACGWASPVAHGHARPRQRSLWQSWCVSGGSERLRSIYLRPLGRRSGSWAGSRGFHWRSWAWRSCDPESWVSHLPMPSVGSGRSSEKRNRA